MEEWDKITVEAKFAGGGKGQGRKGEEGRKAGRGWGIYLCPI